MAAYVLVTMDREFCNVAAAYLYWSVQQMKWLSPFVRLCELYHFLYSLAENTKLYCLVMEAYVCRQCVHADGWL